MSSRLVPSWLPAALALAAIAVAFGWAEGKNSPGSADVAAKASFAWQTATPESQGASRAKLDALKDSIAARKTTAFLVIRNDKIIFEWYAQGSGPSRRHYTASMAKAIICGLSLGLALDDSRIALDDKAARFIPQWKDDPLKSKITIRQLGSHTSGLADAELNHMPHDQLPGWKGAFWKRLQPPNDPFTIARDVTPMLFEPGARLQYSNPGIGMATYAVTASLKDAPIKDIRTLLRERVMRPLGALDEDWLVGYSETFKVDGLPLVASWGGGYYTARTVARVGRLYLHEGDWDGTRIISKEAVRQTAGSAGLPGNCGMGWWTNSAGRYPKIPKDAYYGSGSGDQILLVIPSLNLIMVRNGESLVAPPTPSSDGNIRTGDIFTEYHDARAKILFEPLIEALTK